MGHHSKCLGDRRFDVEIRINPENTLVFKGVVVVRLGFLMHAESGEYGLTFSS